MPPGSYYDVDEDHRLEAQDELRAACRAMGMMGMGGRLAIEVVCYERRVKTADELDALREALQRLARHRRNTTRQAA